MSRFPRTRARSPQRARLVPRIGKQRDQHYQLPFGKGTRTIKLSTNQASVASWKFQTSSWKWNLVGALPIS